LSAEKDNWIEYGVNFILFLNIVFVFLETLNRFNMPYFIAEKGVVLKYNFLFDLDLSYVILSLPVLYGFITIYYRNKENYIKLLVYYLLVFLSYFFIGEFNSMILNILVATYLYSNYIASRKIFLSAVVLFCVLSGISLLYWILKIFYDFPHFVNIANLELQIYHVIALLSPLVVFVFLFSWIVKWVVEPHFKRRCVSVMPDFTPVFSALRGRASFFLVVVILLSVFIPLYPYMGSINTLGESTSPDVSLRVGWLDEVNEDWRNIFSVSDGSRPLFFLFQVFFQRVFNLSSYKAVLFAPAILHPFLVYSVYFVTKKSIKDSGVSLLASVITMFGYTVTVGMYIYFLANVLCLSLIFISLGFLFNYFDTSRRMLLLVSIFSGVLTILIHPWAFFQYFCVLILMTVVEARIYLKDNGDKHIFLGLLAYVCSLGLIDLFYSFFLNGFGGYSALITSVSVLKFPVDFWFDNTRALLFSFGGLLSNTFLLSISAYGALVLDRRNRFHRFYLLLLVVSSVFYLFVDPYGKSRFLVNIPFGVYGAFGAASLISRYFRSALSRNLILLFFVEYLGVYVLRSLYLLVNFIP